MFSINKIKKQIFPDESIKSLFGIQSETEAIIEKAENLTDSVDEYTLIE